MVENGIPTSVGVIDGDLDGDFHAAAAIDQVGHDLVWVIDWKRTWGRPIECSRRWSKRRGATVASSIGILLARLDASSGVFPVRSDATAYSSGLRQSPSAPPPERARGAGASA
jgi:hypothetical protein